MIGKYKINIRNNKVNFELEIKRRITVIKGSSGTGKSTLITYIDNFLHYG